MPKAKLKPPADGTPAAAAAAPRRRAATSEDYEDSDFTQTEGDEDYTDAEEGGVYTDGAYTDEFTDEDDEDDSYTTYSEEEEEEEEESDGEVSYQVDASMKHRRGAERRTPRTPAQQEQQRRLVDLAQASSSSTGTGLEPDGSLLNHHSHTGDEDGILGSGSGVPSSFTSNSGDDYYGTTTASYSDTLDGPTSTNAGTETQTFEDDDDDEGYTTFEGTATEDGEYSTLAGTATDGGYSTVEEQGSTMLLSNDEHEHDPHSATKNIVIVEGLTVKPDAAEKEQEETAAVAAEVIDNNNNNNNNLQEGAPEQEESEFRLLRSTSSCTTECASPNRNNTSANFTYDHDPTAPSVPSIHPPTTPVTPGSMRSSTRSVTPRVGHLTSNSNKNRATPKTKKKSSNKVSAVAAVSSPQQHNQKHSPNSYHNTLPTTKHSNQSNHDHHGKGRVPGGAAAKIILVGPKGSDEESRMNPLSSNSKEDEASLESKNRMETADAVNLSLEQDLQKAKLEFEKGTPRRKQKMEQHPKEPTQQEQDSDTLSEAYTNVSSATPRFLDPQEIFHRTAASAVASLLTPATTMHHGAGDTNEIFFSHSMSPRSSAANSSYTAEMINSEEAATANAKSVTSQQLLSPETVEQLERIHQKMIPPNKTLTDLLTAIASPEEGLQPLGYAVRRKNACGALQTLTTDPSNRVKICWTKGVLPALTSVLRDSGHHADHVEPRIRTEYEAARNRAISALMNMSMVVKNRLPIFHSPGLVHACLWTIQTDEGNARRGCCAVLAFLAKSRENRLLLAQVPGFGDVVSSVLRPRAPVADNNNEQHKDGGGRPKYPWNNDDDDSSVDSSSQRSPSRRNERKNRMDENKRREHDEDEEDHSFSTEGSSVSGSFKGQAKKATAPGSNASAATAAHGSSGYDDTADEFLHGARQNLFAMMGHLVKEKDNAYHFARDLNLVSTVVDITRYQESPSHDLAIKILAHLTRHRLNKSLAFKPKTVVPALVEATQSPNDDARLYACYALQNLSQEKSCRQELAIAAHLIEVLCDRCRNGTQEAERLAAISTLKNLCDEPANLIPMTNTTGCVSTLMHFAHNGGGATTTTGDNAPSNNESRNQQQQHVTETMQYRACDALATLSHWLRKIATSGNSLDRSQQGRPPTKGLFVPSLREVSWNQWT